MKITLHYQLQDKHLEDFLLLYSKSTDFKKWSQTTFLKFASILIIMILIVFLVGKGWSNPMVKIVDSIWLMALLLSPFIWPLYSSYIFKKNARKKIQQDNHSFFFRKNSCTIDSKKISTQSELGKAEYLWRSFNHFSEGKTVYLLQLVNKQFIILPKEEFSKPERSQMKKWCGLIQ